MKTIVTDFGELRPDYPIEQLGDPAKILFIDILKMTNGTAFSGLRKIMRRNSPSSPLSLSFQKNSAILYTLTVINLIFLISSISAASTVSEIILIHLRELIYTDVLLHLKISWVFRI